ncbi:MAG: FimV/HubP family polar landmark protein [Woeseiaceae bacterium]
MIRRSLVVVLLWPLLFAWATSQAAGAESTSRFELRGVLISPTSRSALVNGRVTREGDRVGGAEIIAIDEGAVRILTGSRELTVRVGSTALVERSIVKRNPPVHSQSRHGPVKRGESLSGIAQRYSRHGATMNQMMIALFQANPQAFDGNINVLHEGAILNIPDRHELHRQTAEIASAQVTQHMEAWKPGNQQPIQLAKVPGQSEYGPVAKGESLSTIAERFLYDGATLNQVMIALFQANPQAFSGNINVLHEGAVLTIPNENELHLQAPEVAMNEVAHHTDVWRSGYWRQAQSKTPPDQLLAAHAN